ncbi:ROK family protein [Niabella aquatica]
MAAGVKIDFFNESMKWCDQLERIVAGIDIGGTNTKYGLVDDKGNILFRGVVDTNCTADFELFVAALHTLLLNGLKILQGNYKLVGMGICAPNGSCITGQISYAPNLPWKKDVDVVKEFGKQFKVPVILANDAHAAALGEMMYGSAKGLNDFLMLTLGTGVGGGIVSNGKIVHGHNGFAGELGHIIVRPGGRKHWGTGQYGTLEAYCSATGIAITARQMRDKNPASSLSQISDEQINSKIVYDLAVKGDATAIEVFRFTGQILGEALAAFITFFSPQVIVLFGGVVKAGKYIVEPATYHMENNLLPVYKEKVKLFISGLNEADAAILGSSPLAWE